MSTVYKYANLHEASAKATDLEARGYEVGDIDEIDGLYTFTVYGRW